MLYFKTVCLCVYSSVPYLFFFSCGYTIKNEHQLREIPIKEQGKTDFTLDSLVDILKRPHIQNALTSNHLSFCEKLWAFGNENNALIFFSRTEREMCLE